jgi:hypothetical protein
MAEENRYALLQTESGQKELLGMLKEIVVTSPDPTPLEERMRIKGAMFDTFGVRMFDSTTLEIKSFDSWFNGAYGALTDRGKSLPQ